MLLHWFLGSVGLKLSLKRANFSNIMAIYTKPKVVFGFMLS